MLNIDPVLLLNYGVGSSEMHAPSGDETETGQQWISKIKGYFT